MDKNLNLNFQEVMDWIGRNAIKIIEINITNAFAEVFIKNHGRNQQIYITKDFYCVNNY
jgi:hypothetical protein